MRHVLAPPVHAVPVLLAIALLYAMPLVTPAPLVDPDEGLHAAIAREMAERGDWVTPRFLGAPFLDKPVLFFWAEAAALGALGPTETAARLPGTIFGLAGVATTAALGRALVGTGSGLLAGACYGTMLLPMGLAQAPVHDITLVPFVNLALLAFWRAARAPSPWPQSTLAGGWLGLAILTKGLTGVAIVGLTHAVYSIQARRIRVSSLAAGAWALAVAVAIAVPWYFAMERANPGYLHYFFVERHLLGYVTDTQLHAQRPWWYYLPVLAAGALPWVLFVRVRHERAAAAAVTGTGALGHGREAMAHAWGWLVAGAVFLSLAGSKLAIYALPLLPSLAILAAVRWSAAIDGAPDRLSPSLGRAVYASMAVGAVLLPLTLVGGRIAVGVEPRPAAWVVASVTSAAWLLVPLVGRDLLRRPAGAFAAIASLMAGTGIVTMLVFFPPAARELSARELAVYLNTRPAFPRELWLFDERAGSVVFYLRPELRAGVTPQRIVNVGVDRLLSLREPLPDTLVAISSRDMPRLSRYVRLSNTPSVAAGRYRVFTIEAIHAAVVARTGG